MDIPQKITVDIPCIIVWSLGCKVDPLFHGSDHELCLRRMDIASVRGHSTAPKLFSPRIDRPVSTLEVIAVSKASWDVNA